MKSGGAYVPMDINYPKERIDYILEDTGAELILSQKKVIENNSILPLEMVLTIDLDTDSYSQEEHTNLREYSAAKDLAYVIYTSGTTGKPKGVMVEHRSYLAFKSNDNFDSFHAKRTFWTNYSFDVSVYELFSALLKGSELFILNNELRLSSDAFFQFLASKRISFSYIPPFFIKDLVNFLEVEDLPYLTGILSGVESISATDSNQLISKNISVLNGYGPSETVVCSTAYFSKTGTTDLKKLPIGIPLSNEKVYLLDGNNNPVPIGVVGELFIGGAGLSRGYLNLPELTKECFIENPFASAKDKENGYTKIYKSGDFVKWLPDGNIEFIGRNDDQIKIRGFRVELGEIEHALSSINEISKATVIVHENKNRSKQIIAYIIFSDNKPLEKDKIQELLQDVLPEHMVPQLFVEMKTFPLTTNGKLDKKALPLPEINSKNRKQKPETKTEIILEKIWLEILNIDEVSIHDNFFELGGHSLLTMVLVSKINKLFNNKISVSTIVKYKTIKGLADFLDLKESHNWSPLVQIQERKEKQRIYMISGMAMDVSVFFPLTKNLKDNDIYGLEYAGLNNDTQALDSIEKVAKQNIDAILQSGAVAPYVFCGYSFGGIVAFEMARQLYKRGEREIQVLLLDSYTLEVIPNKIKFFVELIETYFNIELGIDKKTTNDEIIYKALEKTVKSNNIDSFDELKRRVKTLKIQWNMQYLISQEKLPIDITLFRAELNPSEAKYLGWEKYVDSEICLKSISGNHLTMLEEPFVGELAAEIELLIKSKSIKINQ
jgi:amino acid adenylation domain-containing protein